MAYYGLPQPNYQMPMSYQQQYAQQQMQQPIQQTPQMQQPPQVQQMQNGGFMSVSSEQVARNYPVAPGNVITFKIEGQPYVCEKAQGFSQLEGPTFKKYRLVEEEEEKIEETAKPVNNNDDIWLELRSLREELNNLKSNMNRSAKQNPNTMRKNKEVRSDE